MTAAVTMPPPSVRDGSQIGGQETMSEPFMAEIKIVSFNFPPRGWAFCNGQTLPINQNQALFSLMGTTYGGNGQTTFMLPNFQGRVPIHFGAGYTLGENAGETAHTITMLETPQHTHTCQATASNGGLITPGGNYLAGTPNQMYKFPGGANLVQMAPSTISNTGGSQPHSNMQPYLVLNFIVALQGIFPSQT